MTFIIYLRFVFCKHKRNCCGLKGLEDEHWGFKSDFKPTFVGKFS
jgi:hypothetical protein